MKKVGIYIHFPFCVSKCKYCNFNSYANRNDMQLKYFQALLKEISMCGNDSVEVDTIFIGGGTPSIMFDGCVSTVLSEIRKNFHVLDDAEITIEANPNSITKNKAQEWKESGVSRVSVGLQSINSNSLKLIGRPHTKQDYINAIEDIKSVGITNINTDCLIGLPRQKLSDVRRMLGLVDKLGCTHVSVYSLILEEGTPLFDMVTDGLVKIPKEEKTLGMYNFALKFLREKGFDRYEVSNFSKPGLECKHNLNTWQMHEYIGFGAGAHGFLGNNRYANVNSIDDYIKLVSIGRKPVEYSEKISKNELFEETIMLGLRTVYGVDMDDIKNKFNVDIMKEKMQEILKFRAMQMIDTTNNVLRVTDKGMPVLNKIILDLLS